MREALARAGVEMRAADQYHLSFFLRELRHALEAGQWQLAQFCAERCPEVAERLSHASDFLRAEQEELRAKADDLRRLAAHIRGRMAMQAHVFLDSQQEALLVSVTALLEKARARMSAKPLEVPDVDES